MVEEYDPTKITRAGDSVNRALAITVTVYHAMHSTEGVDYEDVQRLADTLSEAIVRLQEAERDIGLYRKTGSGAA
jgi:hypothetical protein